MDYSLDKLSAMYILEIVRYHSVPKVIVFNRDPRFSSNLWWALHEAMGTQLTYSTTFHLQANGQSERTILTLKDLLRACLIDFGSSWEEHLPLVEFSNKKSYQVSIGMTPFKALYGRPSRSPTCWVEAQEPMLVRPELIKQTQKVVQLICQSG